MFRIVALMAVLAAASPMLADEPASSDMPAVAADTAAPDAAAAAEPKQICKSVKMVGTRVRRTKLCGTAAEWAARARADQEALADRQARGRMPNYE